MLKLPQHKARHYYFALNYAGITYFRDASVDYDGGIQKLGPCRAVSLAVAACNRHTELPLTPAHGAPPKVSEGDVQYYVYDQNYPHRLEARHQSTRQKCNNEPGDQTANAVEQLPRWHC